MKFLGCPVVAPLAIWLAGCSAPSPSTAFHPPTDKPKLSSVSPYPADFWKTWGDGQAEVAAYRLTTSRYGHLRQGTAIAITVAEHMSRSRLIKVDPQKHSRPDVFSAMKLNLIRESQTGVYISRDMISAFAALEDVNGRLPGMLSKVVYSSQDWCGQTWSQLLSGPDFVHQTRHTYLGSEGETRHSFPSQVESFSADTQMLIARRIAWPRLRLGQRYTAPMLSSLRIKPDERIRYRPVTMALAEDRQTTVVPAGRFRTNAFTFEDGATTTTWHVEAEAPFRVIRWEDTEGEHAEMVGSARMKYWEMNAQGAEEALAALGLSRHGLRTP